MTRDDDVGLTVTHARAALGDPASWGRAEGYPNSIGKAVLDSVYSLRLRYGVVDQVMRRYTASRQESGADPTQDGLTELILSIDDAGGIAGFSGTIGTKNVSVAARNAVPATLKATTVRQSAVALQTCGIETAADLRTGLTDRGRAAEIKRAWLSVRGSGPVSWD